MSGDRRDLAEDDHRSPIFSRPGSVMQNADNEDNGNGDQGYGKRLQDNVCSQYVQSGHVSSSHVSHVVQVEQDNCCLPPDSDLPDNQELVSLSPLRVSLPSPPPSPQQSQPPSRRSDQSTQDPNCRSNSSAQWYHGLLMARESEQILVDKPS